MKIIKLTPIHTTTWSARLGQLWNRALPLTLRNYLLSLTGSRGFFFFFAMGGVQLEEATLKIQGHYRGSQFHSTYSRRSF